MKKLGLCAAFAALLGFSGYTLFQPLSSTSATTLPAAADGSTTSVAVATSEAPPAGKFVQSDSKTATLRAKIVYDGDPPPRAKIDSSRDPFCAQLEIVSDQMIVGENGELKNFALIMDTRRSDAEVPEAQLKAPEATVELDNKNCVFEPHVMFARPGQKIKVLNSDQTGHNANFNFFNNQQVNFLVPVGGEKELELKADEPAPIPVDCNIHPWMKAFVIVQEHPFVGISDKDGVLEIKDLPVGSVTFRVWHENAEGSIDEASVDGKAQRWSRGRMEVELKAGMNDLGTIKIAADKFKS